VEFDDAKFDGKFDEVGFDAAALGGTAAGVFLSVELLADAAAAASCPKTPGLAVLEASLVVVPIDAEAILADAAVVEATEVAAIDSGESEFEVEFGSEDEMLLSGTLRVKASAPSNPISAALALCSATVEASAERGWA